MTLTVGVLAIQGDFVDHLDALRCFDVDAIEVKSEDDLKRIAGLIIPGGESTSIGLTSERLGTLEPLRSFVSTGKPVWGVCAGLIMLSDQVVGQAVPNAKPYQPLIKGLHIETHRNYFGRQSQSCIREMELTAAGRAAQLHNVAHFIRAPAILSVAPDVTVLAKLAASPIITAVRQGHLFGSVFHAELGADLSWTRYFLQMVADHAAGGAGPAAPIQPIRASPRPSLQGLPIGVLGLDSAKQAMPRFLQGGVIMDVVNGQQAKIAEQAGACAVMALERIPADIRADGGVARMSDPLLIKEVQDAVTLPVMAKARIGHFGEARVLQALDVDCVDESEVLTPADMEHHIRKSQFIIPFVCGAEDLGSALRRIGEGASMIRLKGNAGTGDVKNAVTHARRTFGAIRRLKSLDDDEVAVYAKSIQAPLHLVQETRRLGRLPVVTFAAGGIATPADVILLMEMGCDGVFVGSGIFKSSDPAARARAMVLACTHWNNPAVVAKVSEGLGKAMVGLLEPGEKYALVENEASGDSPLPYRGLQAKL